MPTYILNGRRKFKVGDTHRGYTICGIDGMKTYSGNKFSNNKKMNQYLDTEEMCIYNTESGSYIDLKENTHKIIDHDDPEIYVTFNVSTVHVFKNKLLITSFEIAHNIPFSMVVECYWNYLQEHYNKKVNNILSYKCNCLSS